MNKERNMEKCYISAPGNGWLTTKREPTGELVAVPNFLQCELVKTSLGREYFKPTEGLERGKLFSVKAGNLNKNPVHYRGPANLTFAIGTKTLKYGINKTATAITDASNPIATGNHPIQLPDFPHEGGVYYVRASSRSYVWFYMGIGAAVKGMNDRYLHTGRASAGCVTVEPKDWDELCDYLLLCRTGDGKNVGTITVVN